MEGKGQGICDFSHGSVPEHNVSMTRRKLDTEEQWSCRSFNMRENLLCIRADIKDVLNIAERERQKHRDYENRLYDEFHKGDKKAHFALKSLNRAIVTLSSGKRDRKFRQRERKLDSIYKTPKNDSNKDQLTIRKKLPRQNVIPWVPAMSNSKLSRSLLTQSEKLKKKDPSKRKSKVKKKSKLKSKNRSKVQETRR